MTFSLASFTQQLACPSLLGRVPGTSGHETAKQLILQQLQALRLSPFLEGGWIQTFTAHNGVEGSNLLAVRKGSSDRWLLIGAHYDHIRESPGADDNAAAVGIVLEAVHQLGETDTEANVLIAIFDMEEPPYFRTPSMGSVQFLELAKAIIPIERLECAMILDLCGHDVPIQGRESSLFITNVNTRPHLAEWVQGTDHTGLQIYRFLNRPMFYLSDHYIFDINGIPNLFFTCARRSYYHQKEDTFERLNLEKMNHIASYLRRLVLKLDREPVADTKIASFTAKDEAEELSRFIGRPVTPEESEATILHVMHAMFLCPLDQRLDLLEL